MRDGEDFPVALAQFERGDTYSPVYASLCTSQRKTRGRADRYSLLVRIFHSLLHAGLARRTVVAMLRHELSVTVVSRKRDK